MPDNKREEVKGKIDKVIAKKPEPEEETPEEEKDKPVIWTPFARKIYADIKLYIAKLGDSHPTRAVATKFRNDIDEKLEAGKEKDSMIKYYNKVFKLPGVSTLAWNYFAETIHNPKDFEGDYAQTLTNMEKKYGHIPAWKAMIDGERKRIKADKSSNVNESGIEDIFNKRLDILVREIADDTIDDIDKRATTFPAPRDFPKRQNILNGVVRELKKYNDFKNL